MFLITLTDGYPSLEAKSIGTPPALPEYVSVLLKLSAASDLNKDPIDTLAKVAALTLDKEAPEPLNPPVAVTDPVKVPLPPLSSWNLLAPPLFLKNKLP